MDVGAITDLPADGLSAFTHSLDELPASLPERQEFGLLALRDMRRMLKGIAGGSLSARGAAEVQLGLPRGLPALWRTCIGELKN